ncbi:MAG: LysM peptidoglycan-binding domain-containing protein, partial [Betaproteobacteria bacterium]
MSGQLKKLRIIAFDDSEMKKEVAEDTFVVQVNPQGYGFKHKIEYDKKQGTGTSANDLKFAKISPQELELEFVFDATGAIPKELAPEYTKAFHKENGVTDAVDKFKSVVLEYKGDK